MGDSPSPQRIQGRARDKIEPAHRKEYCALFGAVKRLMRKSRTKKAQRSFPVVQERLGLRRKHHDPLDD